MFETKQSLLKETFTFTEQRETRAVYRARVEHCEEEADRLCGRRTLLELPEDQFRNLRKDFDEKKKKKIESY